MFVRIGRFCHRRRWAVLVAWLVLVVAGVLASGPVFGSLQSGSLSGRFESVQGDDLLGRYATHGARVVGLVDGVPIADPAVRSAIGGAAADLARSPDVARVTDPYTGARFGTLATDGRAGLLVVDLKPYLPDSDRAVDAATARIRGLAAALPGATVRVGGPTLLNRQVNTQVQRDTERAEIVSLPLTLIVLVVIFGGFVAAALPLLGALAAIAGAMICLLGFGTFLTLDPNTVPVVTLLGLGISIDYALLIVSRFREERAGGRSVPDAIEAASATAGRTITFSALTVAVCLAGLFLFDDPTFRAIGAAGSAVVVVAWLAGLTLTPALLALFGRRIPVRRALAPEHGFFSRLAGWVRHRAWAVAGGLAVLLLAAGVPLLSIRLEYGQANVLPQNLESAQVEKIVHDRFPGGGTDPITLVAAASPAQLTSYLKTLRYVVPPADLAAIGMPAALGPDHSRVDITPTGTTQGDTAQRLVHTLREHRPGFRTWVTGDAAVLVDFNADILHRLPYAFGLTALASLVLLFLMTGSLLVPIKALVMNTVSLGATFGLLVWVFQWGHLEGPLGFTSSGAIETWVPVLVFAFAFGVSMDYEVFLLSRIKELYDGGASNADAVRQGLQRSGRIITSAALLLVIVFLGFAAARMVGIKQMGFALATAIVVDATLVRCLLVPATMTLLGDLNWWAPRPLRRLHARIGLREEARAPDREPAPVP